MNRSVQFAKNPKRGSSLSGFVSFSLVDLIQEKVVILIERFTGVNILFVTVL